MVGHRLLVSSSSTAGGPVCTLVTFSRAFTGKQADGAPPWLEDGGTAASSAAMAGTASSFTAVTSPMVQVFANSRSLPPVGRHRPGRSTFMERQPPSLTAAELDMLSIEGKLPSGRAGEAPDGPSSGREALRIEGELQPDLSASDGRLVDHRGTGGNSESPPGSRKTPVLNPAIGISNDQRLAWKMQAMTGSDRYSASRIRGASLGKKKPIVVPGSPCRFVAGATWREHSAPAGRRSNGISTAVRAWTEDDGLGR